MKDENPVDSTIKNIHVYECAKINKSFQRLFNIEESLRFLNNT